MQQQQLALVILYHCRRRRAFLLRRFPRQILSVSVSLSARGVVQQQRAPMAEIKGEDAAWVAVSSHDYGAPPLFFNCLLCFSIRA